MTELLDGEGFVGTADFVGEGACGPEAVGLLAGQGAVGDGGEFARAERRDLEDGDGGEGHGRRLRLARQRTLDESAGAGGFDAGSKALLHRGHNAAHVLH